MTPAEIAGELCRGDTILLQQVKDRELIRCAHVCYLAGLEACDLVTQDDPRRLTPLGDEVLVIRKKIEMILDTLSTDEKRDIVKLRPGYAEPFSSIDTQSVVLLRQKDLIEHRRWPDVYLLLTDFGLAVRRELEGKED